MLSIFINSIVVIYDFKVTDLVSRPYRSNRRKGTSRLCSGNGAIRKKFPLHKPRGGKTKMTLRYLY